MKKTTRENQQNVLLILFLLFLILSLHYTYENTRFTDLFRRGIAEANLNLPANGTLINHALLQNSGY